MQIRAFSENTLENLLQERLEVLAVEWKANRVELDKIEDEGVQLTRDMESLKAALEVVNRSDGKATINGAVRIIGLSLVEAIRLMRSENADLTKAEAKVYLEAIPYDFKGKRPGNAVHMAWMVVDRSKKE